MFSRGVSLHVMPRGSKWWRFSYHFERTERVISLGVYPHVDLATARRLHADTRGSSREALIRVPNAKKNVQRTRMPSKSSNRSERSTRAVRENSQPPETTAQEKSARACSGITRRDRHSGRNATYVRMDRNSGDADCA